MTTSAGVAADQRYGSKVKKYGEDRYYTTKMRMQNKLRKGTWTETVLTKIRFKVLRLISQNPEMSACQVTDEVEISNRSAYYALIAIVEKV